MPKQLSGEMSFDELKDEILFTRAGLKADDDAKPLLSMTDKWLARIVPVRAEDLKTRERIAEVDGGRIVANGRFDIACVAFGDALFIAVNKDRTSARWLAFFSKAVSRFIRMALVDQVARVRSWLSSSTDPVLELHREELEKRMSIADSAVVSTRRLGVARGENGQRRAELVEDLTRERDGVHDALSVVARNKKLQRHWPDLFFAREHRTRPEPEDTGGGGTPKQPHGRRTVCGACSTPEIGGMDVRGPFSVRACGAPTSLSPRSRREIGLRARRGRTAFPADAFRASAELPSTGANGFRTYPAAHARRACASADSYQVSAISEQRGPAPNWVGSAGEELTADSRSPGVR